MNIVSQLLMVVQSFILPLVVRTQDCLQATGENQNLPNFADLGDQVRIPHGNQVIVSSYEFQCCGNISAWGADIYAQDPDNTFNIQFQVWRPSPTLESDGCYSLVGENTFTSLRLLQAGLILFENIELSQQIAAQPGDVVGFSLESDTTGNPGVVMDSSFSSEAVWYGNIDEIARGPSNCTYPVGVLQSSTNLGPVILASISSTSCPPPNMTPTPTIPITVLCHTSTSTNILLDCLTPTTTTPASPPDISPARLLYTSQAISPTRTICSFSTAPIVSSITNVDSTNRRDQEVHGSNEFRVNNAGQGSVRAVPTVSSTSTSSPTPANSTKHVVIIIAMGVCVVVLVLIVVAIIVTFVCHRVKQKVKQDRHRVDPHIIMQGNGAYECKQAVNKRSSQSSMVYNTIYNGIQREVDTRSVPHKQKTEEHIYQAIQ